MEIEKKHEFRLGPTRDLGKMICSAPTELFSDNRQKQIRIACLCIAQVSPKSKIYVLPNYSEYFDIQNDIGLIVIVTIVTYQLI